MDVVRGTVWEVKLQVSRVAAGVELPSSLGAMSSTLYPESFRARQATLALLPRNYCIQYISSPLCYPLARCAVAANIRSLRTRSWNRCPRTGQDNAPMAG